MFIKTKNKILTLIFLAILFLAAFAFLALKKNLLQKPKINVQSSPPVSAPVNERNNIAARLPAPIPAVAPTPIVESSPTPSVERGEEPLSEIQIAVPFTSQAPFAVWDELHNEACEEAALAMAKYWISGEKLTPHIADQEILKSVQWQVKNWGGHYDLPAEQIVELGNQYFGLNKIYILENPTLNEIKKELSKGNLILLPAAGRLLKNPYYRQPGPIYHLVAARGYDNKNIITNDPGTRRGENFKYSYQIILNALRDWPYGPPDFGFKLSEETRVVGVSSGAKRVVIVEK